MLRPYAARMLYPTVREQPGVVCRARMVVILICAACLVLLCLVNAGWVLRILATPREVMYHEAVVYDHVNRIVRGEPLYQAVEGPPYSIAPYMPAYYAAAAGLRQILGPGFGPGRGLSVVAGLTAAILVAWLTARTLNWWAGAFAAMLFLGLGLPGISVASTFVRPWLAFYKEDTLGVVLSIMAIAMLSWRQTTRAILLAAGFAALAFLTKQTFVAASLAGVVWLWSRNRRDAVGFVATWIVVAGGVLAIETMTQPFLANVVWANINPFRWSALITNLQVLTTFLVGPLALAGAYVAGRWRWQAESGIRLLVLYWGFAALPLVGLGKVGSNYNYWIEFAAPTAVLATLGLWTWLHSPSARALSLASGIIVLQLGWLTVLGTPILAVQTANWDRVLHADPAVMAAWDDLLARVRTEPRMVLAEPLDVIALADRPIEFEGYIYNILASEGRWDMAPLVAAICDQAVGLLVLQQPIEKGGLHYHGYAFWPAPALAALRATMQLDSVQAGRYVYVPRVEAAPCGGAEDTKERGSLPSGSVDGRARTRDSTLLARREPERIALLA
jgi:hypothetical protein